MDDLRRPRRRRIRRPIRTAVAVVLLALAAGAVAAPAAQAAPARVWVQQTDPLSTDPVRLQVAAVDTNGYAAPFTGTVALVVGRTRSSVAVRSAEGQEDVAIPTTSLTAGSASLVATLRSGGRTITTTVRGFVDVLPAVVIRGFGCGVVSPTQPRIAWQVVSVNGRSYQYPAWTPASNAFPAYVHTVHPTVITDSSGRPIRTKGAVVVTKGSKVVGRVALPSANRRLLFSVPWPGARVPGSYTATLTLTDAVGRTTTASQPVTVATSSAGLCS
ncbi:hypothetical protein CLV52_3311 [Amnibacterium kyonggiense]|uniref:Ig-like domain-containing protein n=1 Tax=Amnibacterium kyonggiense TaxID=595671 RepID=A0A4R7FJE3_9MICO|nr:hypothetical protein CLV52_3311 [Amnibacterium kyonggiense]